MSLSETPQLAEVVLSIIRADRMKLHTGMPGEVESFDADNQMANIKVAMQTYAPQEDGTMKARSYSVLPSVPIVFEGGGGYRMTYPLQKGDPVWLEFSESSIDAWLDRGGADIDPGDRRRHHIADVVARPGPRPKPKRWKGISTSGATWGRDGGPQIVARESTIEFGGDDANPPGDFVALANKVMAELNSLRDAHNALVSKHNDLVSKHNQHGHKLSAVTGTTSNAIVGSPSLIAPGGLIGNTDPTSDTASNASDADPVEEVKSTILKAK